MFETKGIFTLPKDAGDEDDVMMAALEAGAEDVVDDGDVWTVTSGFSEYDACKTALTELGGENVTVELSKIPENTIGLELDDAQKLMKLLERLEDCDDVQETHTNADFSDDMRRHGGYSVWLSGRISPRSSHFCRVRGLRSPRVRCSGQRVVCDP